MRTRSYPGIPEGIIDTATYRLHSKSDCQEMEISKDVLLALIPESLKLYYILAGLLTYSTYETTFPTLF